MRIGYDAKRAICNYTGLGSYSRNLLNALMLDAPEHDYLLYTPKIKDDLLQLLKGRYELHQPNSGLQKKLSALWRVHGLIDDAASSKVDLYHGLSNELPFGKKPFKTVVTIHDLIFLKHQAQYTAIDRAIYGYKTSYACSHADAIIATSEETKHDIIHYYGIKPDNIQVVYQCCHPDYFKKIDSEILQATLSKYDLSAPFILNVGSFNTRKNQRTLIDAFVKIGQHLPHHLVLAAQSGSEYTRLRAYSDSLACRERIHFVDTAHIDELRALYTAASVFVFPSLYEGFGIPLLEAMACHTPVLASDIPCFREVCGEAAIYFAPTSVDTLAVELEILLEQPERHQALVSLGDARVQQFSPSAFGAGVMGVYQGLISK
jgi:glycosyltransferase involved in cell wall biosynthesis